jgi:hypothetical protein
MHWFIAGLISTAAGQGLNYTNGDLVFGVRDSTRANPAVYLFDLGALPGPTGTVASGLGVDLAALFGSNWYTNTNLKWGVGGYQATNTLVASKVEPVYGVQSTPYSPPGVFTDSVRTVAVGKMTNVGSEYMGGSVTGSSAGFAPGGRSASGGVAVLNSDVNGYAGYMPGYAVFGVSYEGAGFSNVALDEYTVSGTTAANINYTGTFTVDQLGNIQYSLPPPPANLPEGGASLGYMALGLIGLAAVRKRLRA